MILLSGTILIKLKINTGGLRPVPSAPDDLFAKFLALGYIAPDDLKEMKERSSALGIPLTEVALLADRLHPDARAWILSESLGIPYLEVEPDSISLDLSDLFPEALARENRIVPIAREGDRVTVAVTDPFCHGAFAVLEEMTGLSLRMVVCPGRTIGGILARFYPDPSGLDPFDLGEGSISREEADKWLSEGGKKRVCVQILLHAASRGMSGVRMFPVGRDVVIEGRSEAKPLRLLSFPLRFRKPLFDAFLQLAGVTAGSELPPETVFHLESETGVVALQASFLQGLSGPEVIVKILPDLRAGISLGSVGFNPGQLDVTEKVLRKGNGLFLVSSPGPEGVATTLFSMLREGYRPGLRIVTVEERHRFRNEGYIQLDRRQASVRFSGDWSRLAESLEPDILMIEHLPDPAALADLLHLAQAGTLVLCGIRRFNFDRALRTLLTLDVDPFILAYVMRLVLHQRLVKLLCMECRRAVPARPSLRMVGERYRGELERIVADASFYLPSGCPKCGGRGYYGRMALIEMIPFTPGVQNIVASEGTLEEKLSRLMEEGLYSAAQSVQEMLRRGMVTYEDVAPFFR
jgi:type II secretory ATPase GspE/PulE/Tfp pilus assembly ATPase PilB-like protein